MTSTRQWIDTHAVGFATEETTVPFAIMVERGGDFPQWSSEPNVAIRRVPGSNTSVVQFMGRGPETVDYPCKFASIQEFHAFKTLLGVTGTLTLAADVAALVERDGAVIAGERYDRIRNVTLVGIADARYLNGGVTSCTATFLAEPSGEAPLPLWLGVGS